MKKVKTKLSKASKACQIILLLMLAIVFVGCEKSVGKSDDKSGQSSADKSGGESGGKLGGESVSGSDVGTSSPVAKKPMPDTLVVKGLYMRMSGDDALEACKELIASSDDLEIIDFRKGIEVEREVGVEKYIKQRKDAFKMHYAKREELIRQGYSADQLDEKNLKLYSWDDWMKEHPLSEKEIAASKERIKEVVAKKNLIRIQYKNRWKDGFALVNDHGVVNKIKCNSSDLPDFNINTWDWDSLCSVSIDNQGKVCCVLFRRKGIVRLFNAGDLSASEFAQALVDNYPGIPELTPYRDDSSRGWIYKDPRGYKVMYQSDVLGGYYLEISAIKPASARKFD